MRRILSGFGHAAFTSSTDIEFGLIPFANSTRTKIISPLLGLLVAIFLHSTFNFLATTMGPVVQLVLQGHLCEWSTARRVYSTAGDLAFAKYLARRRRTPTRVERAGALRQKILDLKTQAGTPALAPNHAG